MRTVVVVQSRVGSSRLPGKALMALAGRPMLDHVLERACAIQGVDDVVLATTTSDRDSALVSVAAARGVRTWTGSEWDVLGRVRDAASWANADIVVRITGDCPLLCPVTAGRVLGVFRTMTPTGYAWNDTSRSGFPDGMDVEVFSRVLLERAAERAQDKVDREHVTPYIRSLANQVAIVRSAVDLARLKLSVDRIEELACVRAIVSHLRPGALTLGATVQACMAAGVL